jgi:hypothetical protein
MNFSSLRLVLQSTSTATKAVKALTAASALCPDGKLIVDEGLRYISIALREVDTAVTLTVTPQLHRIPQKTVTEVVSEIVEREVFAGRPTDPALIEQEINGCKTLLLEVIRRAAYDWVLYRTSRRLLHRRLAEDAYNWLFLEEPGHANWIEREKAGKSITAFLVICSELDLDADTVRKYVRKLTVKNVMSVGRPAEYRRRETCPSSPGEEHVPALSASSMRGLESAFDQSDSDDH